MSAILQAFIFVFGAIIGSFLNAVIWRLRTGESFIGGRSYCPHCRHELASLDLVPIISYALLGGRCRYCRKGISPVYPLVEAATGLYFLAAAGTVLPAAASRPEALAWLLLYWYVGAVLVIVFVYDLRYMLIPHRVVLSAAALAFIANLALGVGFWSLVFGCALVAGFFYLQLVLSKGKWIGGGDVYLGLLMGAALGWPSAVTALFLAYVSGAVFGSVLMLAKNKSWRSQLPFGTFLTVATAVALLWGDRILAWYLGLIV